jgi:hypothetical protein
MTRVRIRVDAKDGKRPRAHDNLVARVDALEAELAALRAQLTTVVSSKFATSTIRLSTDKNA